MSRLLRRTWPIAFALFFLVVALIVFRSLCSSGVILLTTDDNIGHIASYKRMLDVSYFRLWTGEQLWGMPWMSIIRPSFILLSAVSDTFFMNWFHAIALGLGAWFLALYLHDRGLRTPACLLGGLVAYWVGTNLTLTYAGHIGKYGIILFLGIAIFALGRWGKTKRMAWSLVAAAAAGAMFLEQVDVALFCALLLVPVAFFELHSVVESWKVRPCIRASLPALLTAGLIVVGASWAAYSSGSTEVPESEDSAAKWAYLTQWSQPPSESLDFIAPGWMGWRSGEKEGPYWGKVGQSEGWEQTHQGLMNLRMETVYVGSIPFLLALLAFIEAFRQRREEPQSWHFTLLWTCIALVALGLSFGKYFPLYRVLSWLPGFSGIRNPNKFLHIFQVAWGILAALGLQQAWNAKSNILKKWIWISAALAGLFVLFVVIHAFSANEIAIAFDRGGGHTSVVIYSSSVNEMVQQMSRLGWPAEAALSIARNKVSALVHAAISLVLGVFLLIGLMKWPKVRPLLLWIPILSVLWDAGHVLAPKYIQTMPSGYVADNLVSRELERDLEWNRSAMWTQEGFYNFWLTYLFPYHGILSVNVTQLPRPPADYTAFFQAMGRDPVRVWQLTGVSHVLVPTSIWMQARQNPAWGHLLEETLTYTVKPDGEDGILTTPPHPGQVGEHMLLKFKQRPPRVAAISSWQELDDPQTLARLAAPNFIPLSTAFLPMGTLSTLDIPESVSDLEPAVVEIANIRPGCYEFQVTATHPTIIRVAEKYTPDWKATANKKSIPVIRSDYMFQGLYLPAGVHDVVLAYKPSLAPIFLQAAGLLIGLCALASLLWRSRRT